MKKRINAACKSTFRNGYKAVRLMEKYKKLMKNKPSSGTPSFINMIDTGDCTMVSGFGSLFDDFLASRSLGTYSGKNEKLSYPSDPTYWTSKLRFVPFDDTFTFLPQDVTRRKLYQNDKFIKPETVLYLSNYIIVVSSSRYYFITYYAIITDEMYDAATDKKVKRSKSSGMQNPKF